MMALTIFAHAFFLPDNLIATGEHDCLASSGYQTMSAHVSNAREGLPLSRSGGKMFASRLVETMAAALGLVWAVSAVAYTNAPALGEGLVIRSWRTGAGLPQNSVNAIVQTSDGYLWVGTRDGLARFDGVRFTVFGLPDGLQSVEIQTLFVDRQGTLWIGTSGGGLSRWVEGRIENVTLPRQLAADDTVTALAEDAQGRLWVGTLAGLSVWQNGKFAEMPELASVERVGIRALHRDKSGGMWIATLSQGLYEFRDHRLAENEGPPGNETILAYCLLEGQDGSFWASVGNGTVLCRREGEWSKYTETNGLPFVFITCLAQEADGTLWAGSLDDGLFCFQGGRFNPLRKEQGLSANDIRSLCPDREGNLWVGTRTGGLDRLSRRKVLSYGVAQGLTNDYTRSVAETADGTLWVATTGGGLYRGGPEGFNPILPYYSFAESVLAARDGSVWWGAARGLLCWKDQKLSACYTNETWVRSATVTALCEDRRGGFWIGTSEGRLLHFDDGKFFEWPNRASRGPITALAQEANGNLWVGSMAGGLRRLRLQSDSILLVTNLPSQAVRTLYSDGEGSVWIGTAGAGLCHWLNGRVTTFTSRQGLGADTIVQIVEDDDGYLWLGCSRGILRVRKAALNELAAGETDFLHPRSFGVNDGMPAEECSSGFCPAGLKTKSGMICFSTVKGLVLLDPHRQGNNAPPPNVLLEEVLVNGEILKSDTGMAGKSNGRRASESGDSSSLAALTIPPGGRELELHYTGISFGSPEKLRFRYRLQGLDRNWVEAGERRTAYYPHVPPGRYVFSVLACNSDGVWSERPSLRHITVQPYVWETTWFRISAGLAALGLLAGAARLVERRRYRRRLALMETRHAVERERLRISQDMHDDIGSILTQVSQLSDLGQSEAGGQSAARSQFERIGTQARAAVQGLDEIVWATNPKNDNLPRFAEYVCRFADEFFEDSAVRCWQEVPTDLPNVPLGTEVRHNVFLAVKEAFNNVLKHSGAKEVWLRLAVVDSRVRLEIVDNGRGFNPEQPAPGRNGLANMISRLTECGGQAEIISQAGQGTNLRFSFPLSGAGN
jgi:ligand-binding sensor domain-containing protein/signal transduction histidine kinase